MRKYTLFLSIFVLLFTLLGFNLNSAEASLYAPGCTSYSGFSTTTGQSCNIDAAIIAAGCRTGDLFSSTTGQPCSGASTFPAGCTSTSGFSSVTGDACDGSTQYDSAVTQFNNLYSFGPKIGSTGAQVKALQQFLKDQGYYFGKVDGRYGRITARAVKDFQDDNDLTNTPTPVLTVPSITVLSPNGGESYKNGNTVNISWKSASLTTNGQNNIELIDSNGKDIYTIFATNILKQNSYQWGPLNNFPAGQYKVMIKSTDPSSGITVSDLSDDYFTITSSTISTPLTATKNPNYGNQTMVAGKNSVKIGSFNLLSGLSEGIVVKAITIGLNTDDNNQTYVNNLKLKDHATGLQIGTVVGVPLMNNLFSPTNIIIPASSSKTIDIYGDVPVNVTSFIQSSISSIDGVGAVTGNSISTVTTPLQIITIGSSGSLSAALSSASPSGVSFVRGSKDQTIAKFDLTASSGGAVINSMRLLCQGCASTDFYSNDIDNIKLFDGSTQIGSVMYTYPYIDFSLNNGTFIIEANSTKTITVKADIVSASNSFPTQIDFYTELRSISAISSVNGSAISVSGLPIYGKSNKIISNTTPTPTITVDPSSVNKSISTGENFSIGFVATNNNFIDSQGRPFTWELIGSSSMPSGVQLSTEGAFYAVLKNITTLNQAGSYSFTVRAKHPAVPGVYGDVPVTLTVTAPVSSTCPSGTVRLASGTCFTPPTITPTITVVAPNGGENIFAGNNYTVKWQSNGAISKVYIWLCQNVSGGPKCYLMPNITGDGIANTGSYNWDTAIKGINATFSLIDLARSTNSFFVRMTSEPRFDAQGVYDDSNTSFQVSGITLTTNPYPVNDTVSVQQGNQVTLTAMPFNLPGNVEDYVQTYHWDTSLFSCPQVVNYTTTCTAIKAGTADFSVDMAKGWTTYKSNVIKATVITNVLGVESFHFTQFLDEGTSGNEVMELQKTLSKLGYDVGSIDGFFGSKVKAAVMKFQTDKGLKVDGIVGYEVRTLLNE